MSGYQQAPPPPPAQPQHQQPQQPAGGGGIPLTRLVRVELRKSIDTVASFWLVAAIAILMIVIFGFVLIVGITTSDNLIRFTDFTFAAAYVLQPALAVLAIMLVTSEWGQRTAMVTFSLEPRRERVLYAKLISAAALAAVILVGVLLLALACMTVLELASPDDTGWNLGIDDLAGLLVFEMIAVVMGYALATLILNTPAAIAAFPVLVYVVPLALTFIGALVPGFQDFGAYLNLQGSLNPVVDWSLGSGDQWGHLVVCLLLWVVTPLVVGQVRVLRAEVK
ncbi:hypothetical protein BH11ACT8_BH11ACT8_27510 [soil metagenome]